MNYKKKDKIQEVLYNFREGINSKIIKPIKKAKRRKEYEAKRRVLLQAKGELAENLDKWMISMLNEALADFRYSKKQNHYTIQASHEIKTLFENKLSDYINSTK